MVTKLNQLVEGDLYVMLEVQVEFVGLDETNAMFKILKDGSMYVVAEHEIPDYVITKTKIERQSGTSRYTVRYRAKYNENTIRCKCHFYDFSKAKSFKNMLAITVKTGVDPTSLFAQYDLPYPMSTDIKLVEPSIELEEQLIRSSHIFDPPVLNHPVAQDLEVPYIDTKKFYNNERHKTNS